MRGMVMAATAAALVLAWRYARGPSTQADAQPPSVRVARLVPGSFLWASAPQQSRYLPSGWRGGEGESLKLLVLRARDGRIRAFYLPQAGGRPSVPVAGSALAPGIACDDFAPDFDAGDIACRQSVPGFGFAARHRWSLEGRALVAGTPDLQPALGREADGDWWLQPLRQPEEFQ